MVSSKRVMHMIRLEKLSDPKKTKLLQIAKYSRNDYIALTLIRRFFMMTLAYALLIGLAAVSILTFIMENFNRFNFRTLVAEIVIGYIIVIGVYLGISYITSSVRYSRARRVRKEYEEHLRKIASDYEKEERALL